MSFATYWVESESNTDAQCFMIASTGEICGRLTNYSVLHPDEAGNKYVIKNMMQILSLSKTESQSKIPISTVIPGGDGKNTVNSMDKYAIFQIIYDENLNMHIEYSRMGYFIRVEEDGSTSCEKVSSKTDYRFTVLKVNNNR